MSTSQVSSLNSPLDSQHVPWCLAQSRIIIIILIRKENQAKVNASEVDFLFQNSSKLP